MLNPALLKRSTGSVGKNVAEVSEQLGEKPPAGKGVESLDVELPPSSGVRTEASDPSGRTEQLISVMAGNRRLQKNPSRFKGQKQRKSGVISGGDCPAYPDSSDARAEAALALGRVLTAEEGDAVVRAHLIGLGDVGRDPKRLAAVGNFRRDHIKEKARVLLEAGLSSREIDVLMKRGIVGGSERDAAHYAIATDLYHGRIVESHPFHANDNNTDLYFVKLFNDGTGRAREGLFKPRLYGDNDGWGRNSIEYVAYALNRMLDMDYVPPVAYRRHVDVDFQHFDEGAVVYMVPDAHLLKGVPAHDWGHNKELFLSDARILDVLIQNPDRHAANYIRGKHWADGRYRPMLIDHGAGFRPGTYLTLEHDNAFRTGEVKRIRRRTFEALERLSFDWMKQQVGEFLSDDEIRGVLGRRDGILHTFRQRAEREGWENVVV